MKSKVKSAGIEGCSLSGIFVPILTPFLPDGSVDETSLRRLVNYVVNNGIHGIWAAGTTGEFASLDEDARRLVVETVVDEAAGRVPVIGNISAPATRGAIAAARGLRDCPMDGIAATPPYYFSNEQDELKEHYRAIADQSSIPLWVYNIPSHVKVSVEPDSIVSLAEDGTVIGVKDSSGQGEAFAQLVMLSRKRGVSLCRFVGSTWRITMTGIGVDGIIPGIANLIPRDISSAWEFSRSGDEAAASQSHDQVLSAIRITKLGGGGLAGVLSGLKSALKVLGVIEHDTISVPLRPLGLSEMNQIPLLLDEIGISKGSL